MRGNSSDWKRRHLAAALLSLAFAFLIRPPAARAVSCTSQSDLTDSDRASVITAARHLATLIQSGNATAVRTETAPSVASQFGGIAGEIGTVAPLTTGAALTIQNAYTLDASDLTAPEDQTQFFCGGQNSPEVVFSIPQIPPGRYAIAIMHATGVPQPQQITLIMALITPNPAAPVSPPSAAGSAKTPTTPAPLPAATPEPPAWKLAGLFVRPLTSAGHDGLWYWNKARAYAGLKHNWNAYFYYQTAELLLVPVDFISTPNLDKLIKEQTTIAPPGLPGEKPMALSVDGHSYSITDLHTEGSLGGLDLVIAYQAPDNSDPVATRTRNLEIMHAIVTQHPELREAFHGLWVPPSGRLPTKCQ
jgi:hypothetical protein